MNSAKCVCLASTRPKRHRKLKKEYTFLLTQIHGFDCFPECILFFTSIQQSLFTLCQQDLLGIINYMQQAILKKQYRIFSDSVAPMVGPQKPP